MTLKLVPQRKRGRKPDEMVITFRFQPDTPEGEAIHAATIRGLARLNQQIDLQRQTRLGISR